MSVHHWGQRASGRAPQWCMIWADIQTMVLTKITHIRSYLNLVGLPSRTTLVPRSKKVKNEFPHQDKNCFLHKHDIKLNIGMISHSVFMSFSAGLLFFFLFTQWVNMVNGWREKCFDTRKNESEASAIGHHPISLFNIQSPLKESINFCLAKYSKLRGLDGK